jgi:hypothetical protein
MDHFAGLDVSVKETSICIVDDTGRIVREGSERARSAAAGWGTRSTASSGSDWKPGRYRSGFSVRLPKQGYRCYLLTLELPVAT